MQGQTRKGCQRMQSRLTRQGKAAKLRSIETKRRTSDASETMQGMGESARMHARPQGFARQASNPQGWQAKRDRYRASPHASQRVHEASPALHRHCTSTRPALHKRCTDGRTALHAQKRDAVQAAGTTASRSRAGVATGEAGNASGRRGPRMSAPNLGAHRTRTNVHQHPQKSSTSTQAEHESVELHRLMRGLHASAKITSYSFQSAQRGTVRAGLRSRCT